MIKRLARATRISTALLMAVTVFVPINVATVAEAANITKQVTVLGVDGQPYVGAWVAIGYQSGFQSLGTTPVQTNNLGVASVVFSETISYGDVHVQPAISDTSTAAITKYDGNFATSQALTIQLVKADYAVTLIREDGTSTMGGGGLWDGYRQMFRLEKQGAVGLSVPTTAAEGVCKTLRAFGADADYLTFGRNFATKIFGTGSSRVVKVYSDQGTCLNEVEKVNGVYQLKLRTANISGYLKTNSGQPITFADGEGYLTNKYELNSDGTKNFTKMQSSGLVESNGAWYSWVDTTTAGKHEVIFSSFGGSNYPSFAQNYVYVTAGGKLSWSADGTSPADTLTKDINLPIANVQFNWIETPTSTALGSNIAITPGTTAPDPYDEYLFANSEDGIASMALANGDYTVVINDNADYSKSLTYKINVTGTTITLISASGNSYQRVGNIFTGWAPPGNAKIKVTDTSGNPISSNVVICNASKVCKNANTSSSGLVDIALTDGTYQYVSIDPINSNTYARKITSATVSNGVFTLATGTLESDGSWTVQLPTANLRLNVIDPRNSGPLYLNGTMSTELAYINLYPADANWNQTQGASVNTQINYSGGAAANLENGRYILDLRLRRDSQVPETNGLADKKFRVTVTSGVVSIAADGASLVPDGTLFTIAPYIANLDILVKDETGTVVTTGNIQLWTTQSNGSRTNPRYNSINSTGHAYFYFTDQAGQLTVTPSAAYENLADNRYVINYGNDSVTVVNASKEGSTWVVRAATPNIRVLLIDPRTETPFENAWVGVDKANDNWESVEGLTNIDVWPEHLGNGRAYLPNGKYLFVVNPSGSAANSGLATQTYRVVASDSGVTVSLNGVVISPNGGKFRLVPATSNFEMLIKKADATVFSNGWVNYCKILNGKTYDCLPGRWINSDGRLSAYLPDGTWQVSVHPQSGLLDATEKSYEVIVVDGISTVTGLTVGANDIWTLTTGTPNLSGTLSLVSGTLTFTNNQNVNFQLQKLVNGNWQGQNGGGWSNSTTWAMTVTPTAGQYRIVARPYNFSDLAESYSDPFWVDGSGKFATSETATSTTALTGFNIVLRAPNLKFKVVNPQAQPSDSNYLIPSGWISIERVTGNSRYWVGNSDIFAANPGLTGTNITEPGNYVLRVNPPNGSNAIVGLASKDYQMTVVSSDSVTVTSGGVAVTKDGDRFVLRLATANVTARVLRADGTPAVQSNGKWVNVNLQKLNQYGDWEWGTSANTDDNGYVSLRVETAGKYRLRIEPYGDSQASITYSTEFTVAANEVDALDKKFGSITLAGPSIRISVATADSPSITLADTSIEIRKDGRWIDWANTSQGKVAGISLNSEGIYEFIVHPNGDLQSTSTKKSYKVIATKDSNGVIVGDVVAGAGVAVSGGVTKLLLSLPTLKGVVKDPTGAVAQANAQVYAVDLANNSEKWDYSVNTNYQGLWSMTLPAGKYKIYARAPWGTSEYGTSNGIGEVVVAADGTTTVPGGYSTAAFNILLKNPTWSGVVKAPTGDTVIPQARVCLLISNNWNCANADSVGHFALSMPESFNSFAGTNPILDIADDAGRAYPMNRIQGETDISTALGGVQSNSVTLRLKAPNTEITVLPSEGALVASNLWVVAERDGVGYLSSGTTDNNGVVKLNIASPSLPFKVRVEVNGNQEIAANFAPTTKSWTSTEISNGTQSSIFRGSVTLSPPNFRFIVREPSTAATPVANTWVELLGGNDGPWLGGTNVDFNGFGNFKLDIPQTGVNNYVMIVNPAWNATTNYTRQAYAVTVAASGNITVTNKTSITAVTTQVASGKTVYPLSLGIPSVTGIVIDPDSHTVANSWVVPYNAATNEGYWQQGVNSRNDGQIAMNLATGNYKLEANVPWGTSGVAKSAQCLVNVETGTVQSGGSCVVGGTPNTVVLQLRAPNVKFTLKIGNTPIANANVGVGAGKWWTNAQSNSEGVVSLYIDAVAIRSLNNWNTSQKLYFWIDPPYGSSTMARWSCSSLETGKPLCKDLPDVPATGEYQGKTSDNGSAWVVQGVTPNTRLKIVDPSSGNELANAWVSVLAMNSQGNQWWLAGGNSGIDGYVAMNLETATAFSSGFNKLVLEVQAPWNQRTTFATNLYTNGGIGYTYESLTVISDFSPATPNLKLIIKDSNNYINRYGWMAVEEVNEAGNSIKWIAGYGLNEYGEGSVFLAAGKRYKITSYPGPGRGGASTSCIVATDSGTPPVVTADSAGCGARVVTNDEITIRLNGGNVVGTVVRADGTPVVGAAVYANIPGAATEASAVITVTDETGHYDLQLTANQQWNLKVFPIPSATDNLAIKDYPTAITAPSNGAQAITANFTLAAVVG